jgi:hypothetical protein
MKLERKRKETLPPVKLTSITWKEIIPISPKCLLFAEKE